MMKKFSYTKLAREVIDRADVILEILDARLIEETRNFELEALIEEKGKRLIHVINKSDLAPREYLERVKSNLTNAVFISVKERDGMTMLRQQIYKVASRSKTSKYDILVGVIGYPNVGKSSIINALAGRSSAPVSPVSGHTRSIMNVRITERIMIIDTPGVIPVEEKDEVKLAIIASKNADSLKTPDLVAVQILLILLQQHGDTWFSTTFGVAPPPAAKVKNANDLLDTLEAIAVFRKRLGKGGVPDTLAMGRQVIMDWQRGKYQMVTAADTSALGQSNESNSNAREVPSTKNKMWKE